MLIKQKMFKRDAVPLNLNVCIALGSEEGLFFIVKLLVQEVGARKKSKFVLGLFIAYVDTKLSLVMTILIEPIKKRTVYY